MVDWLHMRQLLQIKKLITVKDAADYCLVSSVTVRRWVNDGKLNAMKLPSGHCRISVKDFRDFLSRYDMPIKEELFESK